MPQSLRPNYSIIIPTHNRHNYFRRIFDYYSGWGCKVFLVDSSTECYNDLIPENFNYLHRPGMSFVDKILHAGQECTDQLIVLSADDDVVVKDGLIKCVFELDANDIGICKGEIGRFIKEEFSVNYYIRKIAQTKKKYPKGKDSQRFTGEYSQILWSVYKKSAFIDVFEQIARIRPANDNYIELIIAIYVQYKYGIRIIPNLYLLREISPHISWGHTEVPLFAEFAKEFLEERNRIIDLMSEKIPRECIKRDLGLYLDRFPNPRYQRLKFLVYTYLCGIKCLGYHSRRQTNGLFKRTWIK